MRFLVRSWSLAALLAATWCLSAAEKERTLQSTWLDSFQTTLEGLETDSKACKTGLKESEAALTDCEQTLAAAQTELGKLRSETEESSKALTATRKDLTDSKALAERLRSDLSHARQHHDLVLILGGAAVVGAFLLGWAIHATAS